MTQKLWNISQILTGLQERYRDCDRVSPLRDSLLSTDRQLLLWLKQQQQKIFQFALYKQ